MPGKRTITGGKEWEEIEYMWVFECSFPNIYCMCACTAQRGLQSISCLILEEFSGDWRKLRAFFSPNPFSIPYLFLLWFDKIMNDNIHLVCNNNVDSLKARKETVKTLYILARSCWKPPFVWRASGKTHYRKHQTGKISPKGEKDAVLFDTSSQGSRHFLFPVITFSGASIKV